MPAGTMPDPVSLRNALEGRLTDARKLRGKRHELVSLVSVLVAGVAVASEQMAVAQAADWDQEVLAALGSRLSVGGATHPLGRRTPAHGEEILLTCLQDG